MFVFHVGKIATVSVLIRFLSAVFVCVSHNQLGYLAFKTTRIKDKTNTSSYSILSRIKQLFIFLALQTCEKKVAEFLLL